MQAYWWFGVLTTACVVGPYVLSVPPRTPRERTCVAATLAFLTWILLLMASLRSD
jgi:hypothetical protein